MCLLHGFLFKSRFPINTFGLTQFRFVQFLQLHHHNRVLQSPHPNPSRSSTALSPPGHVRRTRSLVFFQDLATEQERNPVDEEIPDGERNAPRGRESACEEVKHFYNSNSLALPVYLPRLAGALPEWRLPGRAGFACVPGIKVKWNTPSYTVRGRGKQICKLVACGSKLCGLLVVPARPLRSNKRPKMRGHEETLARGAAQHIAVGHEPAAACVQRVMAWWARCDHHHVQKRFRENRPQHDHMLISCPKTLRPSYIISTILAFYVLYNTCYF